VVLRDETNLTAILGTAAPRGKRKPQLLEATGFLATDSEGTESGGDSPDGRPARE
jgi:hypothetical protein